MADDVENAAEQRSRAQLADEIRRDIDAGRYPVGDRLPGYRELGRRMGAAPNTVGEAVRQLAAEGRVRIKANAGAFVCEVDDEPLTAEQQIREARADLLDLRDKLRSVRRELDALDDKVGDLIDRLPSS
ncbi:winged helix-turn-helix domain-containing protein [Actinosynnema pretiosum]|uniref:winged helix-turn-helix domain-containing protein n=1 Tax=Actinosynnema pretiosum TaxID=42197 RepID=UPI0012FE6F2E|nr:winged helix-turn-helix domain-containing protein [Actinosynnema pretiosum]